MHRRLLACVVIAAVFVLIGEAVLARGLSTSPSCREWLDADQREQQEWLDTHAVLPADETQPFRVRLLDACAFEQPRRTPVRKIMALSRVPER